MKTVGAKAVGQVALPPVPSVLGLFPEASGKVPLSRGKINISAVGRRSALGARPSIPTAVVDARDPRSRSAESAVLEAKRPNTLGVRPSTLRDGRRQSAKQVLTR